MTWRRADAIFVAGAVAVVIGVSLLPTPKEQNPVIPNNADHLAIKIEKDCLGCHQGDGIKPVPARHPKRQDCFRCHARAT
ncbi:MAG TPA: hypothetical protein VIU63_02100 [Nitrospira sp.]